MNTVLISLVDVAIIQTANLDAIVLMLSGVEE
jgi:hypothetical protein